MLYDYHSLWVVSIWLTEKGIGILKFLVQRRVDYILYQSGIFRRSKIIARDSATPLATFHETSTAVPLNHIASRTSCHVLLRITSRRNVQTVESQPLLLFLGLSCIWILSATVPLGAGAAVWLQKEPVFSGSFIPM